MFTSFLVASEKGGDDLLGIAQGLGPKVEQTAAVDCELVRPLGGAGKRRTPFGFDDPFLLERAKDAIEVASVHANVLAGYLGQALEQLVPMHGPLAEEQQESGLDESLHAGADRPVPRPHIGAAASFVEAPTPHARV
jgi:hypothetical protein